MFKGDLSGIQRLKNWCVIWEVYENWDDMYGNERTAIRARYKSAQKAAEHAYRAGGAYGVHMALYKSEWITREMVIINDHRYESEG